MAFYTRNYEQDIIEYADRVGSTQVTDLNAKYQSLAQSLEDNCLSIDNVQLLGVFKKGYNKASNGASATGEIPLIRSQKVKEVGGNILFNPSINGHTVIGTSGTTNGWYGGGFAFNADIGKTTTSGTLNSSKNIRQMIPDLEFGAFYKHICDFSIFGGQWATSIGGYGLGHFSYINSGISERIFKQTHISPASRQYRINTVDSINSSGTINYCKLIPIKVYSELERNGLSSGQTYVQWGYNGSIDITGTRDGLLSQVNFDDKVIIPFSGFSDDFTYSFSFNSDYNQVGAGGYFSNIFKNSFNSYFGTISILGDGVDGIKTGVNFNFGPNNIDVPYSFNENTDYNISLRIGRKKAALTINNDSFNITENYLDLIDYPVNSFSNGVIEIRVSAYMPLKSICLIDKYVPDEVVPYTFF